jgi:hypothetical protein
MMMMMMIIIFIFGLETVGNFVLDFEIQVSV